MRQTNMRRRIAISVVDAGKPTIACEYLVLSLPQCWGHQQPSLRCWHRNTPSMINQNIIRRSCTAAAFCGFTFFTTQKSQFIRNELMVRPRCKKYVVYQSLQRAVVLLVLLLVPLSKSSRRIADWQTRRTSVKQCHGGCAVSCLRNEQHSLQDGGGQE